MSQLTGLTTCHLDDAFFTVVLNEINPAWQLTSWEPQYLDSSSGMLSQAAASDPPQAQEKEEKRVVGLSAFRLYYRCRDELASSSTAGDKYKDIVIKSKARGHEVIDMLKKMACKIGGDFGKMYIEYLDQIGLSNTDYKELEAMRLKTQSVQDVLPRVFYSWIDEEKDIFMFVMENFHSEGYTHIYGTEGVDTMWNDADILVVLKDAAEMHVTFYGHTEDIPLALLKWLGPPLNSEQMLALMPLWRAMLKDNSTHMPHIWDAAAFELLSKCLDHLPQVCSILDQSPNTLIHNDFTGRNLCLRPPGSHKRLCLYDWEVVALGCPQHDLAEFLFSALPIDTPLGKWEKYIKAYMEYFNSYLQEKSDVPKCDQTSFIKVFDMCVVELLIHRLATYGIAYSPTADFSFQTKVIRCALKYLHSVRNKYDFKSH